MRAPAPTDMPTVEADFTGRVLRKPEVCTRILDGDGHTVPVLVLVIECEGPTRPHLRVEQPFKPGEYHLAQGEARRYRKDQRVTCRVPLLGLRIVASHASAITVLAEPTTPVQTPAADPAAPDLFTPATP